MRMLRLSALVLAALVGVAAPARAQEDPKPKPKPAATVTAKPAAKPHAKAPPPKKHAPPQRARKPGEAGEKPRRGQGLPGDLPRLGLGERGFDASIQSPAGAAGLWQFMPDGAKIYGLTVDRWIDERLDPERSTVAAARYLADLRQRFGN